MTDDFNFNEYENLFKQIEPYSSEDFDEIPDGKYFCEINHTCLAASKNKGLPLLKWEFKIIHGPYKGRLLWTNNMLPTREDTADKMKNKLRWLKTNLTACGYLLAQLKNLHNPELHKELAGKKVKITKKTNGEYINYYFGKFDETEMKSAASEYKVEFCSHTFAGADFLTEKDDDIPL